MKQLWPEDEKLFKQWYGYLCTCARCAIQNYGNHNYWSIEELAHEWLLSKCGRDITKPLFGGTYIISEMIRIMKRKNNRYVPQNGDLDFMLDSKIGQSSDGIFDLLDELKFLGELDVLKLQVCIGRMLDKTNDEIAEALGISNSHVVNTVKRIVGVLKCRGISV